MVANKSKRLDAIFFDIDDTLYPTSALTTEARTNSVHAMIKHGLNLPFDDIWRELSEIIVEFSSNFNQHFDKLLLRLPKSSYKNINPATIVAAAVSAYHDVKIKKLHPFEDVTEVLKLLQHSGFILGVISDGLAVKQAEKLVRMQLLSYFNSRAIFISGQIGISKPNPKLYLRVCSDMNLSPVNCMYVGDNPLNDVDPPNESGMITVFSARAGKYTGVKSKSDPDYRIDNFWDLTDILKNDYGIDIPE
ncbi:HAD-IA family hydrolase [Planctomycetota bacterium]